MFLFIFFGKLAGPTFQKIVLMEKKISKGEELLENVSLFQTLCGFVVYLISFTFDAYTKLRIHFTDHITVRKMFLTKYLGQRSRGNRNE